jgi:hypothetical protein
MRYRGQQLPYDPERKVRTTEHVIADLSYNFLEWKVLQRGHWLDSPRNDYGIDATMFHHNERGEVENGEVRFQLKATRKLKTSRDGAWILLRVDIKDLRYWYFEVFPVVIIVYQPEKHRGFWLHTQEYVDRNPGVMESDASTVTLRIAIHNKLDVRAIDRFRELSLDCVSRFQSGSEDHK